MRIITTAGGGDCGYRFQKGKQYIVYATEDRDGQLRTSICTRTRPLDRAAEDVAYARAAFQRKEPLGQISGTLFRRTIDLVRDSRRDRPASGMAVTLMAESQGFEVVTDEKGQFLVHGLPAGRYRASVEVADSEYFIAEPAVVELADPRACATSSAYILPDGHVSGRVLDAARQPITGLTIELGVHFRIDGAFGQGQIRAVTGPDGTFELARVPQGEYVVGINFSRDSEGKLLRPRVFYAGKESTGAAARVKVGLGERVRLQDLVLPPSLRYVSVTGVVLAADGGPVQGARVFLKGERYVEAEPVLTDAQGRFTIAALEGVEYMVFAERPSNGRVESSDGVRVAVASSGPSPLTLTLRRRY
jgi:hypothetical protein